MGEDERVWGSREAAELARMYFGADRLAEIERTARAQAEGELTERIHAAAYDALQTVLGDLNPPGVVPADRMAEFVKVFGERLEALFQSLEKR